MSTNMPNLFLVGAMKAGTTTLFSWLDSHPEIYMSPVKEPNYYCRDLWGMSDHIQSRQNEIKRALNKGERISFHNAIITDTDLYADLFKAASSGYKWCGESSVSYLRSKVAAERIFKDSPNACIIAVLRSPIDRAWSHFQMEEVDAAVSKSFMETIVNELEVLKVGGTPKHGIVEGGLYVNQIMRYIDLFGKDRVLIIDFKSLVAEPESVARNLADFLGIQHEFFDSVGESRNSTVSPRSKCLNRVLAKLGIKRILRVIVPHKLLEFAKQHYYQDKKRECIDVESSELLKEYYKDEMERLIELMGAEAPQWAYEYIE